MKDHFSKQSADYAKYRPRPPADLLQYLAGLAPARKLAWDCGTGNGQTAVALADYFERVIATDISEKQLANAFPHPKIDYRLAAAENSGLESGTIDLLTVSQAVHWFDFDRFYAEARRVLKPGGIIAVWTYTGPVDVTPEVDAIVDEFYHDIVGAYWPPERKLVEEEYRTIPFPFPEIQAPKFSLETRWSFGDFVGYLETWSSTQGYKNAKGADPVELIRDRLLAAWENPDGKKRVRWPFHLRVGKKE